MANRTRVKRNWGQRGMANTRALGLGQVHRPHTPFHGVHWWKTLEAQLPGLSQHRAGAGQSAKTPCICLLLLVKFYFPTFPHHCFSSKCSYSSWLQDKLVQSVRRRWQELKLACRHHQWIPRLCQRGELRPRQRKVWEGACQPEYLAFRNGWEGSFNRWDSRPARLQGRTCQRLGSLPAAKTRGQKGTQGSQLPSQRDTSTLVLCAPRQIILRV